MTNILFQINTYVNFGSTGRIAEEIGQFAMSQGWESYIAYGRNDRPSQSHRIRIGNDRDIRLHGLQTRLFDNHGFASKTVTQKLVAQIENIKPDIIHLHNIHGYYINIEILFNYLSTLNTPIIWTLHDCWAITGHCSHFSYIGCDKWKTHCEKCPQKKEYPTSFLRDNSYVNFDKKRQLFTSVKNMTIVPVSHWLKRIIEDSYLNKYPINVIYNGINSKVFIPKNNLDIKEKYQLHNKFVLLGVATNWTNRKGLSDFIQLSNCLTDEEIILLVGLSSKQIKLLPKNIIGVERTENINELAELYSTANLFVNPTWEDNFPTTNLEALACGTPVLTYLTGGSPEAINDETGFVVEQGNINGMKKAINEIQNKGKEFYSNACRERALSLYNKELRFQEYLNLYNSLKN